MKWTAKNTVLVVLVIAVWSFIGYRAYDYFYGTDELDPEVISDAEASHDKISQTKRLNYNLRSQDYRDPFLGRTFRTNYRAVSNHVSVGQNENTSRRSGVRANAQDKEPKQAIIWPKIVYKGIVQNPNKGNQAALVSVDGYDLFYLKGETIKGLTVLDIYTDSIRLKHQGEIKGFRK